MDTAEQNVTQRKQENAEARLRAGFHLCDSPRSPACSAFIGKAAQSVVKK